MNMIAVMFARIGYSGGGPIGIYGYVILSAAGVAGILAIVNRKKLAEMRKADELKRAKPKETGTPWKCPKCGEEVDPEFGKCWKCGTENKDRVL
jgi:hypothetical protein